MSSKRIFQLNLLDQRINQVRRELDSLYQQRRVLARPRRHTIKVNYLPGEPTPLVVTSLSDWARDQYRQLQTAWRPHGIELPPYTQLAKPIKRAYRVIQEVSSARTDVKSKMGLLAIPPAHLLEFPMNSAHRQAQSFVRYPDFLDSDFPPVEPIQQWRLLVADMALTGLSLGAPAHIINRRLYQIAGYDTRALGAAEYTALTLQHPHVIDRGIPSLLLRDYKKTEYAPIAGFAKGRYWFLFSNANTNFKDYRFRPAIEIN